MSSTIIRSDPSCTGVYKILKALSVKPVSEEDLGFKTDFLVHEHTILLESVKRSPLRTSLLGKEGDAAEVQQWLSLSTSTLDASQMKCVNAYLADKSYLVSDQVTVADISLATCIDHSVFTANDDLPHLRRWYRHIHQRFLGSIATPVPLVPLRATIVELPVLQEPVTDNKATAAPATAVAASAAVAASLAAAPAAETKASKAAAVKEPAVVPATADGAAEDLDPSKLDIRCGLVVKCWNHPDSDKLLCEEIDIGEGTVRTIASGLRAFYQHSEVEGRKVLVLANLKERSMAGFKSQGMVMCASNEDKSTVRLLEPPANANVGDRVVFDGFAGEPATAAQVAKKKILEGLLPGLHTNAEGVAQWKNASFLIGSSPVTAPIPNGPIS